MSSPNAETEPDQWLFLFQQLPTRPAYFRVKIWRRLQSLGAVAVKNSIYVLPLRDSCREAFEWLGREIEAGGGECVLCKGSLLGGMNGAYLRKQFLEQSGRQYGALLKEVRAIEASLLGRAPRSGPGKLEGQMAGLKAKLAAARARDYFSSPTQGQVAAALERLEAGMRRPDLNPGPKGAAPLGKGRTWVTRREVGVDRMASAWLIRRFVDPRAKFRFVSDDYTPAAGEYRFDMFEGEFTHEGDLCTFEVILKRAGIKDTTLIKIARMVHQLDLQDGKYSVPQAAGLESMLEGIQSRHAKDPERLAASQVFFDSLYEGLKKEKNGS